MDPQTINEIADQIANQTILTSWKIWGIQFALWIVGTFIAVFAAAYLAKRGEHRAIAADFESMKEQLVKNTEAITEISYNDWKSREWDQIKRQKLELLYQSLAQAPNDLREIFETAMRSETLNIDANKNLQTAEMIISLYFPAMLDQSQAAIHSYFQSVQLAADQSAQIRSTSATPEYQHLFITWMAEHARFVEDIRVLKKAVRSLMAAMATHSHPTAN